MKIFDSLTNLQDKNYGLLGLTNESFCVYINELFNKSDENIYILTSTLVEATKILNSLSTYTNDVLFYPSDDFLMSMATSVSPELMVTRLETINEIINNKHKIIICHTTSFFNYLPQKNKYTNSIIDLEVNKEYEFNELCSKLIDIGYKRDTLVYKTGDIAIRGYIFDIFPIGYNNPVRIEFFGDTIESIRVFSEETQLSIEELSKIKIFPAIDTISEEENYNNILDYSDKYKLVIKDYNEVKNTYNKTLETIEEYKKNNNIDSSMKYIFDFDKINQNNVIYYLDHDNLLNKEYEEIDFKIKYVPKFYEDIEAIKVYLMKNKTKTIILALKKKQIETFIKYIDFSYVLTDFDHIKEYNVNIINFDMDEGFIYKDYIFLTDKELFNSKITKKKYKTHFKYTTNIKSLSKIEIGDCVVHSIHGIGIYNGIKTLKVQSLTKDYIEVLYKGNDKLYIPVEKIDSLSKFTGKEGIIPKINGLDGIEWQKTKIRITEKVRSVAKDLLRIYAERELQKGFKYGKDDSLQLMFNDEFPFDLTKDQELAISQIKEEMELGNRMDRLLCGDVGFGKTEVAFRTIFKAICNSKQVLYLCPTTILSMQIYNNAKERFKNYPVNIGLLNRFTTSKEAKRILEELESGKIDFVIGTHRILSNDIHPKDLGLLVIDEEQRFGVTHKEKIKKYKANVDVLTLTATPIPRTLQMSLVGIRSMSLITTPPVNRFPVQTYVLEEDKQLIKEAINKELARNGQIFILYNHVETIESKVSEIKSLVPSASIIYAHGRMDRNSIEEKMIKFVNHKADILVCTTIIETGIDIPNVNTLIILEADHFGLSQLYQLRGRVGRSDKIAYAYMMYKKGKLLNDIAVKRLKTIKEFTELGSGFKIASRDLSIRGAGDILGSEQSGFIDSVGIDLYLKILNEEVNRLKGEIKEEEENDTKSLINVSTHIDDVYAKEEELKIEIHRMINTINSYDSLNQIKNEIEDRFGKIDYDIEIYMLQEIFDKEARKKGVIKVNETKVAVEIVFSSDKSKTFNYEQLFLKSFEISRYFKFNYKNECLMITLELPKLEKHYVYYLLDLLKIID